MPSLVLFVKFLNFLPFNWGDTNFFIKAFENDWNLKIFRKNQKNCLHYFWRQRLFYLLILPQFFTLYSNKKRVLQTFSPSSTYLYCAHSHIILLFLCATVYLKILADCCSFVYIYPNMLRIFFCKLSWCEKRAHEFQNKLNFLFQLGMFNYISKKKNKAFVQRKNLMMEQILVRTFSLQALLTNEWNYWNNHWKALLIVPIWNLFYFYLF